MSSTTTIMVPVSPGELIDKMTILEIKRDRLESPVQLANVQLEYDMLRDACSKYVPASQEIDDTTRQLKVVNEQLWDIEQGIREQERMENFNKHFIQLARSVYQLNDRRANLKRQINELLGSSIREEKSYV